MSQVLDKLIGEKTTQILVVSDELTFNPALSRVVEEKIDVEITDCFVCTDKVIFNGIVRKCILYCPPFVEPNGDTGVNQNNNAVLLLQTEIEFPGFIAVNGAKRGDKCVIKAEVGDCRFLSPITEDEEGNILTAVEKLIVDVCVKVIREDC